MIETAIDYAAPIKRELRRLGAQGGDLTMMLNSIESQLPTTLVKNLRFVIAIRNKVMHGKPVENLTPEQFTAACQRALESLAQLQVTARPAAPAHPLAAPAVRLGVTLIAGVASIAAFTLTGLLFPLDSVESWGVPLLALVVLTLHAQATRVRHRLLRQAGVRPFGWALACLGFGLAVAAVTAYLFPPPPESLPIAAAALAVSAIAHLIIGINPSQEGARVAH